MSKDYYQLLGVEKSATKEQIKKAYKKLAMKFHPDRAPEEKKKEYEEKFKEISEAASVLGDEKKRQQYDQFGSAGFQGGHQGFDFSDIMSQFRGGSFGGGGFEDLFDQLFGGGGGRRSRARRGNDLAYELEISLEEAFTGASKTIKLNKLERCQDCDGKGAHKFERCHHCAGSGTVKQTQRTPFRIFQQTGPCPYCHAKGELPQDSCKTCHGEGAERKRKEIEVSIPAGVANNMRLRVRGEGEIGANNGPSGDLYVIVYVKQHKYFKREHNNLHLTIPISFTQATLGDEIDVPLIQGKATLKIPAGTQTETVLRLKGKGMPSLDGGRGDQLVKVHVEIPTKLTKKQKDLIKQLGEKKPSKSFFEKILGI